MAEVQTTTESGEMTQRFIEFVMMQAQNAAFALGQIPHPQTGKGEVNLEMAKLFMDQLAMVRAKTRGNLSNDEQAVLNNAISNLQMAFFEISQGRGGAVDADENELPNEETEKSADQSGEQGQAAESAAAQTGASDQSAAEGESKKKFTKSYGA